MALLRDNLLLHSGHVRSLSACLAHEAMPVARAALGPPAECREERVFIEPIVLPVCIHLSLNRL